MGARNGLEGPPIEPLGALSVGTHRGRLVPRMGCRFAGEFLADIGPEWGKRESNHGGGTLPRRGRGLLPELLP